MGAVTPKSNPPLLIINMLIFYFLPLLTALLWFQNGRCSRAVQKIYEIIEAISRANVRKFEFC